MQLKIYHRLNQLLIAMLASDVVLVALALWKFSLIRDRLLVIFVIALIYNVILFLIFKMIENNWDKRMMQKMAIKGQVALANIMEAKQYISIKDSGNRHYNLWHLKVEYWDQDMNRREAIIVDKFSPIVQNMPMGTVYITNDEKKPLRRFVLQNFIIGNIPDLIPIVAKYENNKSIRIKYLNVYYNGGLIIETFKQSMKDAKAQNN